MNYSKWELQQLKEIYANNDCPSAIDCDDCVINKVCKTSGAFINKESINYTHMEKRELAEERIKLIKLQRILT